MTDLLTPPTSSLRTTSAEDLNLAAAAESQSMSGSLDSIAATIEDETARAKWRDGQAAGFQTLFDSYLKKRHDTVRWDAINPPDAKMIKRLSSIEADLSSEMKKKLAQKLCVLKLNGGLGTSMGCVGPKSIIEVKEHSTFLDLVVKQLQHLNKSLDADVPLILMNSFNTHEDTNKILEKYTNSPVTIKTFNQSRYPRIHADSLLPATKHIDEDSFAWYPPGHGDLFPSLYRSGVLDELIAQGKEYVFISNIDNLAATVNFDILDSIVENGNEYVMEVTDKTKADIKGGTLIKYHGKTKLLEIAQVPKQHVAEFKSIKKMKVFNTNNLWVSLKAIKKVVESKALADVDIIPNPKVVNGVRYLQLETAVGAAIQFFDNAIGINVPRNRFLPVKSTADLFIVQSDLYRLSHGTLVMNPARLFPSNPIVKLGHEFKYISDYQRRFGGKVNVIDLDHLTISGDVQFGANVTLSGTVIIVASKGNRIDIPSGSFLENKVVTGDLRILDH